jgi:predicted transcriptional regulator
MLRGEKDSKQEAPDEWRVRSVDPEMTAALDALAHRKFRSRSAQVRAAVAEQLERERSTAAA